MKTLKAGCILANTKTGKVALVKREKRNDVSFPKGHLEKGESLLECAIRETAEETKRVAKIVDKTPYIDRYTTPLGEECECHMFLAIDDGKSNNTSTDTHDTIWVPTSEVESLLTYESLKKQWHFFKDKVEKLIK